MVGIDIVKIDRIVEAVGRGVFFERAFSEAEKSYYFKNGSKAQTLAGMFAAKEAVIKATSLTITPANLNEIEVHHHENGKPYIVLSDTLKQKLTENLHIDNDSPNQKLTHSQIHISISHDGDYAVAIAFIMNIAAYEKTVAETTLHKNLMEGLRQAQNGQNRDFEQVVTELNAKYDK